MEMIKLGEAAAAGVGEAVANAAVAQVALVAAAGSHKGSCTVVAERLEEEAVVGNTDS